MEDTNTVDTIGSLFSESMTEKESLLSAMEETVKEVDHSDTNSLFDMQSILRDIPNLTYVELAKLKKDCIDQSDSLSNAMEMYNSLGSMTDMVSSVGEMTDDLPGKIKSMNLLKKMGLDKKSRDDFISSMNQNMKDIEAIKDAVLKELEKYADVNVTSRFISDEVAKTLEKKLACIDNIEDEWLRKEQEQSYLAQIDLHKNKRGDLPSIFMNITIPRNGRAVKKMKHYTRSMYKKVFNDAKEGLQRWFHPGNLRLFQMECEQCFSNKENVTRLFILFYHILDNYKASKEYQMDHLIISLMISNLIDIHNQIYDISDVDTYTADMRLIESKLQ